MIPKDHLPDIPGYQHHWTYIDHGMPVMVIGRYEITGKKSYRHLLLFRHKNGLGTAVRKIGKRLLVRSDLFDQWIEKHKEGRNG